MNIFNKIKKHYARKRFIKHYHITPEEHMDFLRTSRNTDMLLNSMNMFKDVLRAGIEKKKTKNLFAEIKKMPK